MTSAMPPRKPGRPKIHASATDRVRAHRAKAAEKAGRSAAGAGVDEGDTATPELAVASLAAVLPALAMQAEQMTGLVQRVESAIAIVADPKALDQRLELMRAETARTVSAAEERAATAEAAAHAATVRADALDTENDELRADAADAWEQTEAAENTAEQARADLEEQKAAHQRTVDELDARQRAEISALQDTHDSIVASLNISHREAIDRYDEENRRLKSEVAEVRGEAKTLRTDLAQQRTDATKREAELRRDWTERIDEQKTIAADLREEISLQRAELDRLHGIDEDRQHN